MPSGTRRSCMTYCGSASRAGSQDANGILRLSSVADGDAVVGMGFSGGHVGGETIQPLVRSSMVSGRSLAPPGQVLLVSVVLPQDGEPLQFGVGLGQRQHRRVAGRDGFHLGVGQFLAADVLGLADGVSPVMT